MLTTTVPQGLPTRRRGHRGHAATRHRRRRAPTCPAAHPYQATFAHLPRARYPSLFPWLPNPIKQLQIPGTIFLLVYMYWFCITRHQITHQPEEHVGQIAPSPSSPLIYEARRRTMAMCNLLAFVIFTLWPCMPPRLLSDPAVPGELGDLSRSFGSVDTVHGKEGTSSVWTQNKLCNQYGQSFLSACLVEVQSLMMTCT